MAPIPRFQSISALISWISPISRNASTYSRRLAKGRTGMFLRLDACQSQEIAYRTSATALESTWCLFGRQLISS